MNYKYVKDNKIIGYGSTPAQNCESILLTADEKKALEEDELNTTLRIRRDGECFSVINQNFVVGGKSLSWFDTLSDEQKVEANEWVQKWRDVTKTHIVPEKPKWLQN